MAFRKEAVGGVRSVSFSLARPLTDIAGLDPLSKVYVYDGRNATTIAEARLADTGRTAAPGSGQSWDCVAFGPVQHASDIRRPLMYVDRTLDGWWYYINVLVGPGVTWQSGSTPDNGTPGLLSTWSDGTVIPAGTALTAMRYTRIQEAGQKIARLSYAWRAGTTGLWAIDAVYSTDGNWVASDTGTPDVFNTGGGTRTSAVGSGITNGRNVADVRTYIGGAGGTIVGDATWAIVIPIIEAIRLNAAGSEILSGYGGIMTAPQVVADLVGRCLPEFDGAGAQIETTYTTGIQQLAYPDGITPAEVLDDMIAIEPAYRWYTTPDATGSGKYGFRWELWPTTVRYEATLDDGGNFPLSTQGLYNQVTVRWTDDLGHTRTTLRTKACPILDDKGLIRRQTIDIGSSSQAQADAAGDAFLDEHNVPKNAGTLTVARLIRDVITGQFVQPWEIEAGELVRVVGVEAYPDAFNADTNDGQGVFRIYAVDYTSEGNAATLALDSDPKTVEDALVKLLNQRGR